MFDIGAAELLLIVIVAILVIGPSEMPRALRLAGQWIAKLRRVSGHFRSGLDAMIREAEIEEMEKEWKEKNAKIMAEHPAEMLPSEPDAASAEAKAETNNGPTDLTDQINSDDPYPPQPPAASAPIGAANGDPDALADAARERARPKKAPKTATTKAAPSAEEPPLPFGTKGEG